MTETAEALRVEMVPIGSITPYPGNPRKNDGAVEVVAASIREFGFRQPIVVDAGMVIVCGHTRHKAAMVLGMKTVPVHVADLTPEQAKAYRLADNRSSDLSVWDSELLAVELDGLRDMGRDLDGIGFSDIDLRDILGPDDVPIEPPSFDDEMSRSMIRIRVEESEYDALKRDILKVIQGHDSAEIV